MLRVCALLLCMTLALSVTPVRAAAEGGAQDWQLTGQTGGTTKALALNGDTLYIGSGLHVLALDVTDPAAVTLLGTSPLLPDFVENITADGNGMLYVSCGLGGLVALDSSDPADIRIRGSLDTRGYTEGVTLYGNYAVVADGPQGVQIVEVSDPAEMKTVSEAYPLAYAYDVAISGSVAYIAGGGSGVFTVDLSDPTKPVEAGFTPLNGFVYDLELLRGRLYAASAWGGVSVLALTDPLAPKYAVAAKTTGWAMALCALGDDLLVLDGAEGAMFYGTLPTVPVRLSSFTLGGFVYAGAADGNTAFVLDREKGLLIFDCSKKTGLSLTGRWMPLLEGRRVTMEENACFVAGGMSGMHVYDMQTPQNPSETYWYDTGGGYANKVILTEGKAYLSTHLASQEPLAIFDAADPLQPEKISFMPNDEVVFNTAFRSISYQNGYIYVPGEFHDMAVDVTDALHPKAASKIELENPVNGDCSGPLYISTNSRQLQLIDVSNPQDIRLVSTLEKNSSGEAVRFLNSTTVITSADPGIWIVDVSDPINPKKISELALPGSVMDICLDGTTAYLAALGEGVYILDLSDPTAPKRIDTVKTLGIAYDCSYQNGILAVADSFAGMTVYRQADAKGLNTAGATQSAAIQLTLKTSEEPYSLNLLASNQPSPSKESSFVVTSAADSGEGTLRYALEQLDMNTTITFDPGAFPVDHPATISLESPLPEIVRDHTTIDASNAGVILDGSNLESGNGLTVYSFYNRIMGMQIVNFPQHGIDLQGGYNVAGGSRKEGGGPMGQGNLLSGNGLYGIRVGGYDQTVLGNYVGVDLSGENAMPNYDGVFVTESDRVTVGGTREGEGNVISGNQFINFDSWGDHTRVIGNFIGLNAAGTKAVSPETSSNVTLESNVMNAVVGGTTPEERNVISGANIGVVFSDPNSYNCSLTGNYIGTDVTGTKAVPNHDGVTMWTSGNHRVGGTSAGEANLISGNQNGVQLNGYGVSDNIVIGNILGYDADGKPLPNETPLSVNMGQKHAVIGGYTAAEGNRIYGGSITMRISDSGIQGCLIAGNRIDNPNGLGVFFESGACNNFAQGNSFTRTGGNTLRADVGEGNMIRANSFVSGKPQEVILLLDGGNRMIAPPEATATAEGLSGITVPFGRVEAYRYDGSAIVPVGFTDADKEGTFTISADALAGAARVLLLVTDALGNTSQFSNAYLLTAK